MQLAKLLHIGVNKQITYTESIEGNNSSLEYLFLDISPIGDFWAGYQFLKAKKVALKSNEGLCL